MGARETFSTGAKVPFGESATNRFLWTRSSKLFGWGGWGFAQCSKMEPVHAVGFLFRLWSHARVQHPCLPAELSHPANLQQPRAHGHLAVSAWALKHQLEGEGGCSRMTVSPTAMGGRTSGAKPTAENGPGVGSAVQFRPSNDQPNLSNGGLSKCCAPMADCGMPRLTPRCGQFSAAALFLCDGPSTAALPEAGAAVRGPCGRFRVGGPVAPADHEDFAEARVHNAHRTQDC